MAAPAKRPARKKAAAELLPLKSAEKEIGQLRQILRVTTAAFAKRVRDNVSEVEKALAKLATKSVAAHHGHEVRDILSLVRKLRVKPAKGRRRDLKRIESLAEELRDVVKDWK